MCTVSWCCSPKGFHFFFNRDEQRSRPLAIPPCVTKLNNTACLFPVDPRGKGTWLGVNSSGYITALLNYYDADKNQLPVLGKKSRGQIVMHLLGTKTRKEIVQRMKSLELESYPPFHLLWGNETSLDHWIWNGSGLTQSRLTHENLPFSTSSEKPKEVIQYRAERFRDLGLHEPSSPEKFQAYHRDQPEGTEWKSPNVSRLDVQTVSFSEIILNEQIIEFRYDDFIHPIQITHLERASS